MVDDDVAARPEPHAPPQRLLDVLLDPEGLEDRLPVRVEPDAVDERGRQRRDVRGAFPIPLLGVDDELVDVR